ncbi:MAG: Ig-like domain-containing protein [Verrucomicrobiota bacterium]
MRFLFSRTGATNEPLTVHYQSVGSATNGVDFERLPGRITIPAGTNAVVLSVLPINDIQGETPETVRLQLVSTTNSFTLAILPDTQYYSGIPIGATNNVPGINGGNLGMFAKQTQWIVDHRDDWNISFVLHEGDCTDHNTSAEWQNVKACMDTLNGVVPYAIAVGNHDGMEFGVHNTTLFNQSYPLAAPDIAANLGGVFESNRLDNCYHFFRAGGMDWLVLSLEFGPRDEALAWAGTVVSNYPNHKVIVVTHAHLAADNTLLDASNTNHTEAPKNYWRPNDGVDVWEKFVKRYANIAFVFNGHIGHGGLGQLVGIGDHGNKVYQFACNYQFFPFGGGGFMRVLKFYPDQDKFEARSFSPYFNQVYADPNNQFTYTNLGLFTNISSDYSINALSNTATISLISEDLSPIVANVSKVTTAGFPSRIEVRFDRAVTLESATNLAHYALDQGPAFTSAQLKSDGRTVRLMLAANLNPNEQYQLIITGVRCVEPSSITNPPSITTNFVFTPVMLVADFSDGTFLDWTVVDEGNIDASSAWQVVNGVLAQFSNIYGPSSVTAGRRGTFAYYNDVVAFGWSNYVFTTTVRSTDDDGIGVMFCYKNPANYYKFDMDQQRQFRKIFRMQNGVETTIATQFAGYVTGSNYQLSVQVSAAGINVTLGGQSLFGGLVPDTNLTSGSVALYSWGNAGSYFSNITVTPLVSFPLPQISFVTPTNNTQITNTTLLNVAVSTVDPGSVGISEVEYLVNGARVSRAFQPPYQALLVGLQSGTNQLDARLTDSLGRQSWATPVQLNVIEILPLLRLLPGSPGPMQMDFRVSPDGPMTLQASSNLLDWESLGVWTNLSLTPLSTLDPGATNLPARFYRVIPAAP